MEKKQKLCGYCGNKTHALSRLKPKDGYVCGKCMKKLGIKNTVGNIAWSKGQTLESIKEIAKEKNKIRENQENFEANYTVGLEAKFNDKKRIMLLAKPKINWEFPIKTDFYELPYENLVSYEIDEDGEVQAKGGLKRTAVGGLLFGGAGAVVGAITRKKKKVCKYLRVIITTTDEDNPTITLDLISSETKVGSFVYNTNKENARKLASKFEQILAEKREEVLEASQTDQDVSVATQIREFKQLLDDGIITEAEFEQKKKQLMNL
ncbi:SHOCT domain-containing protein [Lactobacillus mulieris]|uniref:SHOCT domain-containing protein n=1 Tax=Lactobacillus mulieris TaxID=2508708 RepID=UPI001432CBEB|nr:SHOCT domain-containing protein [Lactobacillus mulieris]MCF1783723.1 SHOCT domain-containing protein [Lactobacillus mulieris]MCW8104375.1 SHOCT domain-containing protein [Lactobacillus mulieris]MDK6803215.1 SHOCT domain-containing protein [Lactobacillus mulieris]MDK8382331.1 SHOCT domain-containing protein [Lactobacillus mulieris]MDT9620560.1 SHOCT domain-containing protein [Lactobacillus mulieris]